LRVKEGQTVKRGDIIAVLNLERATAAGGVQAEFSKQISARRNSLLQDIEKAETLYQEQVRALKQRLHSMRTELAQIESGYRLQQERIRIGDVILGKQRSLHENKFISDFAFQQKEQERLAELATLENIKRNRTNLMRDIGIVESEIKTTPIRQENERSGMDRNLAAIEQDRIENESRRELHLVAPQSGVVAALAADIGKLAIVGQPLLSIIPAGAHLQADVYVPARAIGFIREGSKALLQYQAYPYQKFGSHEGRVVKIARTAVTAIELPFPAPQGELFYVTTIDLSKQTVTAYGQEAKLNSGMMLDANILLDRRTLFEWVFEPFYSITGRWERNGA
jgi:membrane fusion protein